MNKKKVWVRKLGSNTKGVTYIVLPKEWIVEHGFKAGDSMVIRRTEIGDLIIEQRPMQ